MASVEVRDFSYTYPGATQPALRDINLALEAGSFVVITGKSGCGKSTLAKALAGFLFQDEAPNYTGEIIVNETSMSQTPLFTASERVAYVQQNPEDQFCTLTVLDEIAFGLENRLMDPAEIDQRIDDALTVVKGRNLKNRQLATLSGGEKQKVAIAAMLALSPDVLILDEPTSSLDPIATQNVFASLHHMRETSKMTVIIIEHKLSLLAGFDPQVVALSEGTLAPIHSLAEFETFLNAEISAAAPVHETAVTSGPVLSVSDLSLTLDGRDILDQISFELFPGEFVGLMGPNGSGKSTLLQSIMGFYPTLKGDRRGFGRDLRQARISSLVPHIGYLFQNPDHQLFAASVWEEAVLTSSNLGSLSDGKQADAREWLGQLGLLEKISEHPQRLSYGEKRRLNLVAAMLHDPQLLLIDELLIGQDMVNATTWMALLADYAAKGNTILLVNHHADLTRAYCTRVLFLDAGRLLADDAPEAVFSTLAARDFGAFLPSPQKALVDA